MDPSNERIERLLVLLLLQSMKGTSQREKVIQLNIAGFSNFEIAEFLDTSPAVVATLLYQSKKSGKPKKRRS
jgi:DNA-directed RNA polymerase specialized sigma24 family protein